MYTYYLALGKRRLEVRCYGPGQVVLVDIHVGRVCGYSGHHSASSHTLRWSDTNRQKIQRISNVSKIAFYFIITPILSIQIYCPLPFQSLLKPLPRKKCINNRFYKNVEKCYWYFQQLVISSYIVFVDVRVLSF